jgi:hypothetical protein
MSKGEWRFSFEVAWDDPWYRWQTILTAVLFVVGSVFFLFKLIPIGLENGLLVFHYNLYLGIDEMRHWAWLMAVPPAVFLVMAANLTASFRLYRHDTIASRVLLCAATIFTALMLTAGYFMVYVNS